MLELTASQLLEKQAAGDLTAEALAQSLLARINQRDGVIKSFLSVDADGAMAQARAVDAGRKAGQPLGKLAGIPVAVKDVICIRDNRTSAGSRILQNFVPP